MRKGFWSQGLAGKRVIIPAIFAISLFSVAGQAHAQSAGWSVGDDYARIYTDPGTEDLNGVARADLNLTARHIRLVGKDGNFEFENATGTSRLNAYLQGSPNRTPFVMGGGDEQNVVGLKLDSGLTQTADILQFQKNGSLLLAVNSQGGIQSPSSLNLSAATDIAMTATRVRVVGSGGNFLSFTGQGDLTSTAALNLSATSDLTVTAGHLRLIGSDGTLELQTGGGTSRIVSYQKGTSTRIPTTIGGGDSQNLVSLIVDSAPVQSSDIAQFRKGGTTVAAFDAQGRLRLGGITVELQTISGRLEWVATMPDGSKRYSRFTTSP